MTDTNSTNKDIGAIGEFAVGEFNQLNSWAAPVWPNFALPVRHKIAPALAIALIASGLFSGPLLDQGDKSGSYNYGWSEPVRQKPGLGSHLQQFYTGEIQPSVLSAQAWFAPLSEPVRLKLGLRAGLQQFHTGEVHPSVLSAQAWFAPLSEPVREKIGTKAANQPFLAYVAARTQNYPERSGEINFAEETQFSKYSYAWSEPVRVKPGVQVGNQDALFFEEEPPIEMMAAWYDWLAEPIRLKPGVSASNQDALFFEEEPPIEMMAAWYDWLSEPVRQKKGLGSHLHLTWTFDTTPVPTGRYYGWYAPFSEPVRKKPELLAGLQRAFTQDVDPVPLQRGMAWYANYSDPVRLPVGLKANLQQTYAMDGDMVPLPSKIIAWFQWFREPVRTLEGLKVYLQQTVAYHPRIVPNPDVTGTMDAIENHQDVAIFGVNVYNGASSASSGQGARVSITEVAASGGDPVSIRES